MRERERDREREREYGSEKHTVAVFLSSVFCCLSGALGRSRVATRLIDVNTILSRGDTWHGV